MRQLPQPPNLTFAQKIETARWLARCSAYSVMVLLRHSIGYRALNPLVLVIIFASLTFLSGFGDPVNRPQDVVYFATVMLAAGFAQRFVRWRRPGQGHSYYIGTSWLQSLPWPAWMQRNRFIPRFVDSALVFCIGLALLKLGSPLLGIWLLLAGLSLKWLEFTIHQKELNRRSDIKDGLIESEEQGDYVEQFSTPPAQNQNQSDDPGIAVGIGDDIREQINRNQNK